MEEQNHFVWLQKAELRPTVGIYKVTNVESFLKKGGGRIFQQLSYSRNNKLLE